jgi:hypothetical protein
MQEIIEFRIPEENAERYLRPEDGVRLGESVRKLVLPISDSLVTKIRDIESDFQARGESFYLGWDLRRRYTVRELNSAEAFLVIIKRVFEPAGEQCGTVYDESKACQYCGSGAPQVSDLILDPMSLPRRGNLAIAETIAGEVVVSETLVKLFRAERCTGGEFRPVKQKTDSSRDLSGWYQLVINSKRLKIAPSTRAGIQPFQEQLARAPSAEVLEGLDTSWCDKQGNYRCPLGHTIGLNLLSELSVRRSDFKNVDIACTEQRVGVRRGVLRPRSMLVVSPRFRKLVEEHGLKGMNFEITYL